ncbi:hypothetical protein [Winogradskyella luteola]|uniref:Uncharacterized protein n=1 Tax=Winogradskyella luteola TaxID=2828330 RepID=A0A9X1JMP5_9FLAO|nr:hypothetical protein [Winogradskyella luteola]MBV7268690.1 hypothetical protein [Winogradskyella luteola]
MKLIFGILFSFIISIQVFCQDGNDKSMLLISTKYHGEKCEYVAFRVSNRKINIDRCYDLNSEKFNPTETIDLLDETFIRKIYRKSTKELLAYENEINEINYCDYMAPITILISENDKNTKIELKGIRNCHPKSMKVLIEGLEKTFEKYK